MAEWGDYHYSDKTEADEWENPNASGYYSPYHHPQYDYHYPGYGGSSPYCDSRHRTCFVGIPRTDASRPVDIECSSQNTTRLSIQPQQYSYTYKVKIVNLSKKSVYSMTHLEVTHQFESLHDLKQEVHKAIPAASNHSYGYMEPGHGLKGKQRLLLTSDDLAEMYQMHKNKREIVLWCYGKVEVSDQSTISTNRKRSRSPDKPEETMRNKPGSTKKQALANKIKDVEDIVLKLQDKHGSDYSVEKLNAWAHLIHMDKHGSYDTPPNLPYFKKPTNKAKENNGANVPQHQKSGSSGLSPSKRLGFRSECIDQLSKWHALMEKDGITREQYEELKNTIMGDISTF